MSLIADIADAVWEHSTRTLDAESPAASNGTYIDDVAYAIWTNGTRELDGDPPETPEGSGLANLTIDATATGQSVRSGSGTAALTVDAIGTGQSLRNGSGLADLVLDCIGVGESEAVQNQLVLTATQVGSSVFLEWEFAT